MFTLRLSILIVLSVLGLGSGSSVQAQELLAPGASLPSLQGSLQHLNGTSISPRDLTGTQGTVFIFWSTRCPWVDRYEDRVQGLVSDYQSQGFRFVLVNANPDEPMDAVRTQAEEREYNATYVRDPTAAFARAVGATRTPHAFVFDDAHTLVYVGAIDDSPSSSKRVQARYLRAAVQALVEGDEIEDSRQKAFGCALRYP